MKQMSKKMRKSVQINVNEEIFDNHMMHNFEYFSWGEINFREKGKFSFRLLGRVSVGGAANLARRIGGRPVSWFALGVPYNYI
jgi:hypothetical protein